MRKLIFGILIVLIFGILYSGLCLALGLGIGLLTGFEIFLMPISIYVTGSVLQIPAICININTWTPKESIIKPFSSQFVLP